MSKTWIAVSIEPMANSVGDKLPKELRKQLEVAAGAFIQNWLAEQLQAFVVTNVDSVAMYTEGGMTESAMRMIERSRKGGSVGMKVEAGKATLAPTPENAPSFADTLAACTGACHVTVIDDRPGMSSSSKLTENETALLLAIRDSEFHDATMGKAKINNPVWVDCLWGFEGKAKFGGVMASLTKKGLAQTDGECAWITETGYAAVEGVTK